MLELSTHGSNLYDLGGPWQTTIDGQRYLQYSPALVDAVLWVVIDAQLPLGVAAIWGCGSLAP